MSRESILKIREAETEAERIIDEARRKAQEMTAEAERLGREHCAQTEAETRQQAQEMMAQLRERTVAMDERIIEGGAEEVEELKREAGLRKKSAEKIVLRGLSSKCR